VRRRAGSVLCLNPYFLAPPHSPSGVPAESSGSMFPHIQYTDKKENKIFLIYKEIQMGAVAMSYMMKGFIIYEEMRNYSNIYEESVSHI
jgi:hypothetical protein